MFRNAGRKGRLGTRSVRPDTVRRTEQDRKARGSALLLVIILSLVATAITTTFLVQADSSSQSAVETLRRRQAFYAADGMSRIVIREVQNYMILDPNPSTQDLQDPENIPPPSLDGFTADDFQIYSTGDSFDGSVPSGPFEGMFALQKPIRMDLVARDGASGIGADIHLRVMLGQVSMFQFLLFGDAYTEAMPGAAMTINPGRVHSNYDLCLGSTTTFQIERVTASGRILASDSRCRRNNGSGVSIWNGSSYTLMNSSNDNGCTNCAGSGMKWQAYAQATWKGRAKDSSQGVPHLRLPITGSPQVQAGLNAAGATLSNAKNTRLLVDPVLASDTPDILDQKFASLADIRIINGVWYKNDGTWPGLPLWSDHPGSFTTKNEEGIEGTARAVGQRDLATARGWASTRPKRYSYYEYDESTGRLAVDANGIVSYGTVNKGTSTWKPGFWAAGARNSTYTDVDGKTKYNYCNYCSGAGNCSAAIALRDAGTGLCQYSTGAGYASMLDAQYLQGARGGFIDYRVRNSSTAKAPMLPMNFDLEEFAAAMRDTTRGELGSYFNGGLDFNGIIFVTNTWPGSMGGLPNTLATLWPDQGSVSDSSQSRLYTTPMAQTALPYQLCSDDLGYVAGSRRVAFSYPPSDGNASNGFEPAFTIPSCSTSSSATSRPNAVRLINGSVVSSVLFPKGLSIVSNLPVYVVGDLNTSSNTTTATSTPWIPVLVGSDALTLLSKNWNDKNAPWDNSVAYTSRTATATTYNFELLAGNVETTDSTHYSGGLENFPRFLESWSGITATITGSFVLGFASVYHRHPWYNGTPVYDAPTRNWSFDNHLKVLTNQPPGAPRFSIYSVSRLNRK